MEAKKRRQDVSGTIKMELERVNSSHQRRRLAKIRILTGIFFFTVLCALGQDRFAIPMNDTILYKRLQRDLKHKLISYDPLKNGRQLTVSDFITFIEDTNVFIALSINDLTSQYKIIEDYLLLEFIYSGLTLCYYENKDILCRVCFIPIGEGEWDFIYTRGLLLLSKKSKNILYLSDNVFSDIEDSSIDYYIRDLSKKDFVKIRYHFQEPMDIKINPSGKRATYFSKVLEKRLRCTIPTYSH